VVAPDPAIGPLLAPYLAEVEAICAEPLATASVPLSRSRGAESALGNLVADAMRAWGEADVAIINSGSLRADLAAGPVSYCDVYGLFPFDSRFVVLEVTGAELERILEFLSSGAHSMPQVSGLRLAVHAGDGAARDLDGDGAMADWERDRLVRFTDEAGQPLDAEASYRFVATDYIVGRPGDAEFVFGQIPAERTTASDDRIREAIAEHLGTVATPLGTDGGWPLPDPDDPRVRYEGAEAP
jgi:5'-nucleotidase